MSTKEINSNIKIEGKIDIENNSSISTPSSGFTAIGVKSDGELYKKDSSDVEVKIATQSDLDLKQNLVANAVVNEILLTDEDGQSIGSGKSFNDNGTTNNDIISANKIYTYIDSKLSLQNVKDNIKLASTANINLANTVSTIDSVSITQGDKVLLKNQTNTNENGFYIKGSNNKLTRSEDANTWEELINSTCFVLYGTVNANRQYRCTIGSSGILGTDAITFALSKSNPVVNTFNVFTDADVGNDSDNNGSSAFPFKTITQGLTIAQFPQTMVLQGQSYPENITLSSSKSNITLYSNATKFAVKTILSGAITTQSEFTRLRCNGFNISSGSSVPVTFGSGDLGRHVFENIAFTTTNSNLFSIPTNFSNWIYLLNCDFSGLSTTVITLPSLQSGNTATLMITGALGVISLVDSTAAGWTIQVDSQSLINWVGGKKAYTIVQQIGSPELPISSTITSQSALTTLLALSGSAGIYLLTGFDPTQSGSTLGYKRGDIIYHLGAGVNMIIYPFASYQVHSVYVLAVGTYDKTATDWSLVGAATISDNSITNAKLSQVATNTIKGRISSGTGNVEDLTSTQATSMLNTFVGDTGSGGAKGLVPAPTTGDASKFLKGDGSWDSTNSIDYVEIPTTGGVTNLNQTNNTIFVFTGTQTQAIKLPDATTIEKGIFYYFINKSTTGIDIITNVAEDLFYHIVPDLSIDITLTDNTSADGNWSKDSSSYKVDKINRTTFSASDASKTFSIDINEQGQVTSISQQAISITPSQAGLGNVTNNAQLKRSAGDFGTFNNQAPTINDTILFEENGTGTKYKTTLSEMPLSSAQQTAINNALGGVIEDQIVNGVTDKAPSQNAVYDALALKQNSLGFTAENSANKNQANGYAGLDSNSKININQIPATAIPILKVVADETARFALTTDDVQDGDTVKQTDTGALYLVKDDTNLNNSNGYEIYTASADWSSITNKPSDIFLYNTNDASDIVNVPAGNLTSTNVQSALNELDTNKQNTELGKGLSENDLTDALKSTYDGYATEISAKANSTDVYLKTETYSQTEVDNLLDAKEDTITNLPTSKGGVGINDLSGQNSKLLAVKSDASGYEFVDPTSSITVIDGFSSTSTTDAGSAKNDNLLDKKIVQYQYVRSVKDMINATTAEYPTGLQTDDLYLVKSISSPDVRWGTLSQAYTIQRYTGTNWSEEYVLSSQDFDRQRAFYNEKDGFYYYFNESGSSLYKITKDQVIIADLFQSGHDFVIGEALYNNAGTYTRAIATTEASSIPMGLVSYVNGGYFYLIKDGYLANESWSLTAGTTYYLSPSSAGGFTSTRPTTNATKLFTAISTFEVIVDIQRLPDSNIVSASTIIGFKNRIINGDMRIDQRNGGASFTPSSGAYTYSLDRWFCYATQSSKYTVQQNAGSVTPPAGFKNYLGVTSSSAYSITPGDIFMIGQKIEGLNIADLGWGTPNAKPITISVFVYSSLTGTFGGTVNADEQTYGYPFTYTISSPNTWEQQPLTIPGPTAGTWLTTNGLGLQLNFGLGVGSTSSGTPGSWQTNAAGNFSATGATSVVGTNGATFYFTGVQLEKGSVATDFDFRDYQIELARCQRYLEKSYTITTALGAAPLSSNSAYYGAHSFVSINAADNYNYGFIPFKVPKRANPSITLYNPETGATGQAFGYSTGSSRNCYSRNAGTTSFEIYSDNWATNDGMRVHWAANSEL